MTAAGSEDLAVVVNKSTFAVLETMNGLRQAFLGERSRWPDGKKLVAAMLGPGHAEFAETLKLVCGMSQDDYKKYLLQADFAGKTLTVPKQFDTPAAVKAFVMATPGAIGILNMSDVDDSVRQLRIDGASPGSPGYKLHPQ
jgi:hypothetical protein